MTLGDIPNTTLIVGTDAAGKDHVANILTEMIIAAGGTPEKRKRFLSGKTTTESSSAKKSRFELVLETGFILLYPLFGFLLPLILTILLRWDLRNFSQPEKKLVVVGHNCLRGLAFHWGQKSNSENTIRVPRSLNKAFQDIQAIPGLHIIVLDVEDNIRQKRIKSREAHGEADNFDKYMASDSRRSERIERILVWLTTEFLQGQLIENNDLSNGELRQLLTEGFMKNSSGS